MSSHFVQASSGSLLHGLPALHTGLLGYRRSLSLRGFVSASREEADLLSEQASSATFPWLQDTPPFCHAESGASF